MARLEGKVALVTGAAHERGIGRGIVRALAEEGSRVAVVDIAHEEMGEELAQEVGEPNLGILFDTWHLWDTPDVLDHIRREAHRFVPGIHIDDWREPTRGWTDRALPGEGAMDLPALFGALDAGGWDGWCDMEFFSDDGSIDVDYPDSLWRAHSYEELIRRGRDGFERAWAERKVPA